MKLEITIDVLDPRDASSARILAAQALRRVANTIEDREWSPDGDLTIKGWQDKPIAQCSYAWIAPTDDDDTTEDVTDSPV